MAVPMLGCEAAVDAHVTEGDSYPIPCHVAALSAAASAHSLESQQKYDDERPTTWSPTKAPKAHRR